MYSPAAGGYCPGSVPAPPALDCPGTPAGGGSGSPGGTRRRGTGPPAGRCPRPPRWRCPGPDRRAVTHGAVGHPLSGEGLLPLQAQRAVPGARGEDQGRGSGGGRRRSPRQSPPPPGGSPAPGHSQLHPLLLRLAGEGLRELEAADAGQAGVVLHQGGEVDLSAGAASSRTSTERPARTAYRAAVRPAGPPPATMISVIRVLSPLKKRLQETRSRSLS